MAFFGIGKKCDLFALALELEENADEDMTRVKFKDLVMENVHYGKTYVKEVYKMIINSRLEEEEKQRDEKDSETARIRSPEI
ncbi:hypothetical protein HNY73_004211 [Argiope bruennichi]|uniref:Uncharacterized protein n=1 Tax=Argiope bruennichi TaxID=94029 RepID=A0A8T0FSH7_ARGBR|nr:hypothetical protein HNY73_004211 [Argiope bruennichi]